MYTITPETFNSKRTLILFPVISLIIFLSIPYFISDFSFIRQFPFAEWQFMVAIIIILSYSSISIFSTKMLVDQDALQYKRMLTKYYINWDEIIESKLSYNWMNRNAGLSWVFITNNNKSFEIPTHFFQKKINNK